MESYRHLLEKQGYRFTGSNSAVKICYWTKKSLVNEDVCYKQQFYNVPCHQCCQMTPCLICPNRCVFCWRDIDYCTGSRLKGFDRPEAIIRNSIDEQKKLLAGFGGNRLVNKKKLEESKDIRSFAISLSGEPTLYPMLDGFLECLSKLRIKSFLVTSGVYPKNIRKLDSLPTQLYVSLDAPTKQLYNKIERPTIRDSWSRLNETLSLLPSLDTRTTIRITAVKGLNMVNPKAYARLVNKAKPMFLEVKAYMWVGSSRSRLEIMNMPLHNEVKDFANYIAQYASYKIVDEKENSRVVLLMKDNIKKAIDF